MTPFFNDHTSYGAVFAMFIPFLTFFSFSKYMPDKGKWVSRLVLLVLFGAFILSYTRAAWLSLMLAIGVYADKASYPIQDNDNFAWFLFCGNFYIPAANCRVPRKNDDESSSNLMEHFSSMSNITSDASNLERLNRWGAAIRMFEERPVFGFGPGTYMFKYAPYQLSKDRTIISTNMGDMGNAHSEYLGPWQKVDFWGCLLFSARYSSSLYCNSTYSRLSDGYLKGIVLTAFLGLVTYYAHGFMNNFLDTDKAAVPFWGFTAMIVMIDLHSRRQIAEQQK
jgi:putative inorganic carbon (hco3(-)) transporter